jgi:hypothetical protein
VGFELFMAELRELDSLTESYFPAMAVGEKVNNKNSLHVQEIALSHCGSQ